MRWLHIYSSMLGLATLLFFSVTGLTLNHAAWFIDGAESRREATGIIEPSNLQVAGKSGDESIDKLAIVESLRAAHTLRGALADFNISEEECVVTFKGPGYAADVFITRATGSYQLMETRYGLIAVLNDFHKGRDTGAAWSWVIDLSAGLCTLLSLTGLVLVFYIRRRLIPGLLVGLGGLAALLIVAYWLTA